MISFDLFNFSVCKCFSKQCTQQLSNKTTNVLFLSLFVRINEIRPDETKTKESRTLESRKLHSHYICNWKESNTAKQAKTHLCRYVWILCNKCVLNDREKERTDQTATNKRWLFRTDFNRLIIGMFICLSYSFWLHQHFPLKNLPFLYCFLCKLVLNAIFHPMKALLLALPVYFTRRVQCALLPIRQYNGS